MNKNKATRRFVGLCVAITIATVATVASSNSDRNKEEGFAGHPDGDYSDLLPPPQSPINPTKDQTAGTRQGGTTTPEPLQEDAWDSPSGAKSDFLDLFCS